MIPRPTNGISLPHSRYLWEWGSPVSMEPKFDGWRCLLHSDGSSLSRHGKPLELPSELRKAARLLSGNPAAFFDAEWLAPRSNISALVIFDCYRGITTEPYEERRRHLESILGDRITNTLPTPGVWLASSLFVPTYDSALKEWRRIESDPGLEGAVIKPLHESYAGANWIKFRKAEVLH